MAQTLDQNFRVISENVPCGSSGVTCAKNIMITYNQLTIVLIRGRNIEVNGKMLKNFEEGAQEFGNVRIMKSGMYYVVKSNDFVIKWDGGDFKIFLSNFI